MNSVYYEKTMIAFQKFFIQIFVKYLIFRNISIKCSFYTFSLTQNYVKPPSPWVATIDNFQMV